MTTINKQEFIRIYKDIVNRKSNREDVILLIKSYCLDNGKKEDDINNLIEIFLGFNLTFYCLSYPIDYYKNKFNIYTLKDAENNIILIY